mmetsp:Transcript_6587/g.10019  ORF Transcript_6587/g.10019 Transcript_6587/m.10019 type:complete len:289 (-) Transcript_6587:58-924(-)
MVATVVRRKKPGDSNYHEKGMTMMESSPTPDEVDIESGHSESALMNSLIANEAGENSTIAITTTRSGTYLKPIAETTPMERAMGLLAICTITLGIVVIFSTPIVFAGIFSSIMGAVAYFQQTRITDIKVLQETKEAAEREVDRLAAENGRLSSNIADLSTSVERLDVIDEALKVITETQGQSVLEFEKQAKEAREILETMKLNQRGAVLQNLLSIMMVSDTDGDFIMDENEIATLIQRIEGTGGVRIHESRFRAHVQDKPIDSIMTVMKNLLSDNIPSDQKIFVIEEV